MKELVAPIRREVDGTYRVSFADFPWPPDVDVDLLSCSHDTIHRPTNEPRQHALTWRDQSRRLPLYGCRAFKALTS
jgi:hypothetical protein